MAGLAKAFMSMHTSIYRATKGKVGGKFGAAEILLLTTTGRKSGQPRTTPLNHYNDGDRIVLIASNNGSDHDPAWYLNVRDNPTVTIQRGGATETRTTRVATPEEKAELWPKIVAWSKGYAKYQAKTSRDIPLVIVE